MENKTFEEIAAVGRTYHNQRSRAEFTVSSIDEESAWGTLVLLCKGKEIHRAHTWVQLSHRGWQPIKG